ncbi:MAG: hypothetical protein ACT4OK_22130 [Gemmobacter sp.]
MTDAFPGITMQERDFDLLILEELAYGAGFADALLQYVGVAARQVDRIRHSVTESFGGDAWGETDLLVTLRDGPTLLIENKLTAGFQPDQALRYRHRAAHHASSHGALTILIAPGPYLAGVVAEEWDFVVPYETLAEWIECGGPRAKWRKGLLLSAGTRARRLERLSRDKAAQRAAQPELVAFKAAWRDAANRSGEWHANPQSGGNDDFLFRPRTNPNNLTVWHHPMAGYLSVQVPPGLSAAVEAGLP